MITAYSCRTREEATVIQPKDYLSICVTICNLPIEMPQLEDASWAKAWCHATSTSISRQLWTCGEWLNKFMDPEMHFESLWT
jgi:hypothetical protein